jgi:UPF0755 protein
VNDGLELFDDLDEDDRDHDHGDHEDRRGSGRSSRSGRSDPAGRSGRSGRRTPPPRGASGKKKRRGLTWSIVVVLVVLIAGGAYYGYRQLVGIGSHPDYAGPGTTDVVFQVNPGDTITQIGSDMQQAGIVASAGAFVDAGRTNTQLVGVQPGFYVLKEHMSGAAAVAKLTAAASRVGLLEIKSGWQLDDTTSPNGQSSPGILTRIAKATCATLDGRSTCLTPDQLRAAIASTPAAQLGVPDWAAPSVTAADADHRFEGLIMPGVYNLKPGETAVQTLKRIMDQSSAQLQAAGLPGTSQQSSGFSPYQLLTLASIVERESGTASDMPKIARVFYNRLQSGWPLQSDAIVDYGLDRPMETTAPADRAKAGAYNSYSHSGLPPTPVSSPSAAAIQAASQPSAGPWMYFVVCQQDRSSCFATTFADHNKNIQIAIHNGVF